jgi:hypothetical protein
MAYFPKDLKTSKLGRWLAPLDLIAALLLRPVFGGDLRERRDGAADDLAAARKRVKH